MIPSKITYKDDVPFRTSFASTENLQYMPPYLRDTPETPVPVVCKTRGIIPNWINGNFVRPGTGRWTVPVTEDNSRPPAVIQHWFDALGILHKFHIFNGKVTYSSRHTAEGVVRQAKKDGFLRFTLFGPDANTQALMDNDPVTALYKQHQSEFTPVDQLEPDEATINVTVRRGFPLPKNQSLKSRGSPSDKPETDELCLLTDSNIMQIADANTLEPKRLLTYAEISSELKGFGICGHPPKDRYLGHMYNYLVSEAGELSVFALDYVSHPTKLVWKTVLPCPPGYVHSMAMTRKYAIFIRQPLSLNAKGATNHVLDLLEYEEDTPTVFFVLNKEDGKLVDQFECSPFLFNHSINAYDYKDENGKTNIHIDLCTYAGKTYFYFELRLSNFLDPAQPFSNPIVVRYELAGVGSTASASPKRATVQQSIHGVNMELPRINKTFSMKPGYRYVWGTCDKGGPAPGSQVPLARLGNGVRAIQPALIGGIVKTDWETGKSIKWMPSDGDSCPCEPIFIQRPGATEEDDGVALTITCNKSGSHSILVVLDGKTLEEIGSADMPQVYGVGFHGTFIEDETMYLDKTHYV